MSGAWVLHKSSTCAASGRGREMQALALAQKWTRTKTGAWARAGWAPQQQPQQGGGGRHSHWRHVQRSCRDGCANYCPSPRCVCNGQPSHTYIRGYSVAMCSTVTWSLFVMELGERDKLCMYVVCVYRLFVSQVTEGGEGLDFSWPRTDRAFHHNCWVLNDLQPYTDCHALFCMYVVYVDVFHML